MQSISNTSVRGAIFEPRYPVATAFVLVGGFPRASPWKGRRSSPEACSRRGHEIRRSRQRADPRAARTARARHRRAGSGNREPDRGIASRLPVHCPAGDRRMLTHPMRSGHHQSGSLCPRPMPSRARSHGCASTAPAHLRPIFQGVSLSARPSLAAVMHRRAATAATASPRQSGSTPPVITQRGRAPSRSRLKLEQRTAPRDDVGRSAGIGTARLMDPLEEPASHSLLAVHVRPLRRVVHVGAELEHHHHRHPRAAAVLRRRSSRCCRWTLTGFMLAMGTTAPLTGYLGGRFSFSRCTSPASSASALASVLCGMAWDARASLVAFRFLQGALSGAINTGDA